MSFQDYSNTLVSRLRAGDVNKPLAIGLTILLALILCVVFMEFTGMSPLSQNESAQEPEFEIKRSEGMQDYESDDSKDPSQTSSQASSSGEICVYVSGCVKNPGVCYLPDGSRVADAVAAVGGATADAKLEYLNLARIVEDGEHISVLSEADAEKAHTDHENAPGGGGNSASGASTSDSSNVSSDDNAKTVNPSDSSKININMASSSELQKLKGIGQSKADRIIAYRDANGSFKSIEELTKVSGIGDKTLENIRDAICV